MLREAKPIRLSLRSIASADLLKAQIWNDVQPAITHEFTLQSFDEDERRQYREWE